MNNIDWSIIICCYNSSTRIKQTLTKLANIIIQQPQKFEVIIVNNASTDDTKNEVSLFFFIHNYMNFKVIDEETPGLIHARKTGINNSNGKYIAFIDDDNWVMPDYFKVAESVFDKNILIGIFGCSSKLPESTIVPDIIKPYLLSFAVGELYSKSGILPIGSTIWGAGLSIRANIAKIIFFDKNPLLLTGRSGNIQLAGDDTEICYRLQILGYLIWYQNTTLIIHAIDHQRFNENSLFRMSSGFGYSSLILMRYNLYLKKHHFISINLFLLVGAIKIIFDLVIMILSIPHKNTTDYNFSLTKIKSKILALFKHKNLYKQQSTYLSGIKKNK